MTKRSIQTSNPGYYVGIEIDTRKIRASRVSSDGRGGFAVAAMEEATGDFSDDSKLTDALRQVKNRLGVAQRDAIVTCLSGKQVFATQMDFRRLTGEEMEQALRLELRKIVHFEVATSALDYEILEPDDTSTAGQCQVMVSLAANSVLSRQMLLLDRAGLRPAAMDVLPLTVANALWIWRGGSGMEVPCVAMHIGPQVSTLVIDGEFSPFFNRNIPFAIEEANGEEVPGERAKKLSYLADEVSRSLAFYEKSSGMGGFRELVILGEQIGDDEFAAAVKLRTGLSTVRMDLATRIGGLQVKPGGDFDLALALALRGDA